MKKIVSLFIVMLSCALVSAQENIQSADSIHTPWTFAAAQKNLKFSPFDVFSGIPTLSADLEVSLQNNIRLQGGVGIIFPGLQFIPFSLNNDPFEKMSGYRLRAEGRFFSFKKPTRYFATEISMRHLIIKQTIGIGMEPSESINEWGFTQQNFAYFINTDMLFHRFNTTFNLKYGFEKIYDNGFVLDMYAGLSMRKIYTRTWTDIPEGGTVPMIANGLNWNLGDRISRLYFTPIVGVKVGFVLNHKNKIR